MEHEKQIKDGDVKLDPGMDAMTLVFGKENGGFLKGVGTGVTANKYFLIPRTKGSSKEQIADLKFELHNERLELQKKDEELKALSTKVREQDNTLKLVLAHLESQGTMIPNLPSHLNQSPTQVSCYCFCKMHLLYKLIIFLKFCRYFQWTRTLNLMPLLLLILS